MSNRQVDVAIIGAGSAGLFALSAVKKSTQNYVLIDGGELGTTCARVGCMPSKVAIQIAEDFHRRKIFARHGIQGGDALTLNVETAMEHVQDLRDTFVDRVLSHSIDEMGDEFIEGYARFVDSNTLKVNGDTIEAKKIIIATGSSPIIPSAWDSFRDRVLSTDDFFEQTAFPDSMAVIGLGAIGIELGQSLQRMGVQVTGIDQVDYIAGLQDPIVNEVAIATLAQEFPLWLGQPATVTEQDDQLLITCGERQVFVDKLLASLGRKPNIANLGLDRLGVSLDAHGLPPINRNTMQVADLPIFIAGDVTGDRAILHEAGDEGRIAGYNATHEPVTSFARKTPFSIVFSDPNIVHVGQSWSELAQEDIVVGEVRLGPVGRALIMAKNKGILRIYVNRDDAKIVGATLMTVKGENLGHLLAWCIQQQLTVFDLLRLPFYHPTMEEALQAALYAAAQQIDHQGNYPVELTPFS